MSLVINVAGTSGAGKTHLILDLLRLATKKEKVSAEGLKHPAGYDLTLPGVKLPVHLLGDYDRSSYTGGCDVYRNVNVIFNLLNDRLDNWEGHIIYEGLYCMNMTRGPELARVLGSAMHVLVLTTPLATCVASINSRRTDAGLGVKAAKHTEANQIRAFNYADKMKRAGARVHRVSRTEALPKMLELITR